MKRETFIREFEREKAKQEWIWEEAKAQQQWALEDVERKLQAKRNDLEVLTRENGVLDEIMRKQFNVPDGVQHYKSFLGSSMVRMSAETFDMMKSRLDAANKIQVVSYFDRNRYRELINLDSYKEIRKATAEAEAAKRKPTDLRREYDAFIERTNKNYSFFKSFLHIRNGKRSSCDSVRNWHGRRKTVPEITDDHAKDDKNGKKFFLFFRKCYMFE